MSLSKDQLDKTIEQLENVSYGVDPYGSTLTKAVYALRKTKLKEFNIENLRVMIGQSEGLKYLIPMALEKLHKNVHAEGDLYPGDLLSSVLSVPDTHWQENPDQFEDMKKLIAAKRSELENSRNFSQKKLMRSLEKFL